MLTLKQLRETIRLLGKNNAFPSRDLFMMFDWCRNHGAAQKAVRSMNDPDMPIMLRKQAD